MKYVFKLFSIAFICSLTACNNAGEKATEEKGDSMYVESTTEVSEVGEGAFIHENFEASESKDGALLTGSATPPARDVDAAVNDLIGRGYDYAFDKIRDRPFEAKAKRIPEKKTKMNGLHVTKSSDYSRLTSKKGSGSASGIFGSVSGGASSKYSISKSSDEEIFVATVTVQKARYEMEEYRLTKRAKKIIQDKPQDFTTYYGSRAVTSVTTGAECNLVFKFKARTSDELQTLRQRISGSSGLFDASASASLSNRIRELRANYVAEYAIIVNGLDIIPKDNIDSAIAYFFKFDSMALKSSSDVILDFNLSLYDQMDVLHDYNPRQVINYSEIDSIRKHIRAATNMIIEADGWLTDIANVLDSRSASLYDNGVKAQATADRQKALNIIAALEQFLDDIYQRQRVQDPSLLDRYAFDRPFYPQRSKPRKPSKRVDRSHDGNIAADRGGGHTR